jgi:sporulation protein YlmC with PRC-barrel domain
MKIKPATFALTAMLAIPGVALAQTTTSPAATSPATPSTGTVATTPMGSVTSARPSAMTSPATASAPTTTSTYTTTDQMTRASKIIGATVYNDQDQSVGSVSELLINSSHDITDAVLSVGGFLGIDSKLVKVPYHDIHVTGDRLMMSGVSKDQLKQMPDYKITPAHAS